MPKVLLDHRVITCIALLLEGKSGNLEKKRYRENPQLRSRMISELSSNLATLVPDVRKREYELWNELHDAFLEQHQYALAAVKTHRRPF